MLAGDIQTGSFTMGWASHSGYPASSMQFRSDPGVDDPVGDTGVGPRRGDLQRSNQFALVMTAI